jgi:hypothetical protein
MASETIATTSGSRGDLQSFSATASFSDGALLLGVGALTETSRF